MRSMLAQPSIQSFGPPPAAGATVLILITGMLFLLIERRRDLSDTGGF